MHRPKQRFSSFLAVFALLFGVVAVGAGLVSESPPPSHAATFSVRAYLPLISRDQPLSVSGFTIHFLDVGQGDAILVSAGGQRLLIDGGPSRERLRTRLQALGITDIDAIAISNPDADHIRGLIEALAMFNVERVYTSGSSHTTDTYNDLQAAIAAEPGIQVVRLARGDVLTLGGLALNVLHPDLLSGDRNRDSLTLRLTCGSVDVLLMGDATAASEQAMLAAGLVFDIEVLKAGHHGSNTSSSQPFLDVARPEHAVFSAGRTNQYGHPHPDVVSRLTALGATLVYTDTTEWDDTNLLTSNCATYSFTTVGSGQVPAAAPTRTPTPSSTAGTATPTRTPTLSPSCDPNYTGACVPPYPPDVNCGDIPAKNFRRVGGDPHGLDGDNDGIACEN